MRVGFGSFVLDSGSRELRKYGSDPSRTPHPASPEGVPVHRSPKAFDVLEILAARRPNVVSKDVLLAEVWPGKVVEEANLAMVVGEIRKALGDDSKSPAIVVTVARHGYRFAADLQDLDAAAAASGDDTYPRWWLTWNDKALP